MDREGITAEQEIVGYLDAAGPVHDDLRRILTQVSGFSMMLFTSDKRRLLPADLIHDAARDQAQTTERIRALRVPERAGHHHHHLTLAADAALLLVITRSVITYLQCVRTDLFKLALVKF